jgi:hypothetical protein
MSQVLCSVPIAVPIFRMRATLECRDLGSPAHRAAERLRECGAPTDYIAAALGLRVDQTENLLAQLDGTGGQGVRELRVWIDLPHGAALTAEQGLDLITGDRQRDLAHLPILPPKPSDLEPATFTAAASSLAGPSARIVVDDVRALEPDLRDATTRFHHVLHLSRCDLVVTADGTFEIHWHDEVDERLTAFARELLSDDLLTFEWASLTPATAEQELSATLERAGVTLQESYAIKLDPYTIHEHALALVHSAERQIVLAVDAPLRHLPDWLDAALEAVRDRQGEVEVHLLLSDTSRWKGRHAARLTATTAADLPSEVLLIRDGDRGLIHSSAAAFGAESAIAGLHSQAAVEVHEPVAIRRLLERLHLPCPHVARRSAEQRPEDVAAEALRKALGYQRRHLDGLEVAVTSDDVVAFVDQVERTLVDMRDPRRVAQLAAGVCWERAVYTRCVQLADHHPQLVVDALRWTAPEGRMDLDIILRDLGTKTWWVLDAKHDSLAARHLAHVRRQLDIARDHQLVPPGWDALALIVYPPHASAIPELTNDKRVRRTTFDMLAGALGLNQ